MMWPWCIRFRESKDVDAKLCSHTTGEMIAIVFTTDGICKSLNILEEESDRMLILLENTVSKGYFGGRVLASPSADSFLSCAWYICWVDSCWIVSCWLCSLRCSSFYWADNNNTWFRSIHVNESVWLYTLLEWLLMRWKRAVATTRGESDACELLMTLCTADQEMICHRRDSQDQ